MRDDSTHAALAITLGFAGILQGLVAFGWTGILSLSVAAHFGALRWPEAERALYAAAAFFGIVLTLCVPLWDDAWSLVALLSFGALIATHPRMTPQDRERGAASSRVTRDGWLCCFVGAATWAVIAAGASAWGLRALWVVVPVLLAALFGATRTLCLQGRKRGWSTSYLLLRAGLLCTMIVSGAGWLMARSLTA